MLAAVSQGMMPNLGGTIGLIVLIAASVAICIYAFLPHNAPRFDRAKRAILTDGEGPLPDNADEGGK